jgi:hypothetical protein
VTGDGGIFVHRVEAHDDQSGCLSFSYVSGSGDRLPPHHACVSAANADLRFEREFFGEASYGQLAPECDRRILEEGPGSDEMGAFGYLSNAHKLKNIRIRYREFIPAGVRPVLIPVT